MKSSVRFDQFQEQTEYFISFRFLILDWISNGVRLIPLEIILLLVFFWNMKQICDLFADLGVHLMPSHRTQINRKHDKFYKSIMSWVRSSKDSHLNP